MPDPNPSNRERLLRLIDGGTDALKEMHTDEPASKTAGPAIPSLAKKNPVDWQSGKLLLAQVGRYKKWIIVSAALVAALYFGLEMTQIMKRAKPETSPVGVSAVEAVDGPGLRLVGVDSSDASPVALLEDLKTGKTYFVRVNEKVKDARVKQIQKNKVVVSYHGKNVELR